ncbi:MAG TPA: hypothetical protein ENK57_24305 [Polyangiaceae bacterium]|nr:hypothetical protein [Polyangiaceae bacterium]
MRDRFDAFARHQRWQHELYRWSGIGLAVAAFAASWWFGALALGLAVGKPWLSTLPLVVMAFALLTAHVVEGLRLEDAFGHVLHEEPATEAPATDELESPAADELAISGIRRRPDAVATESPGQAA